MMLAAGASQANLLANPGFEDAALNGWTLSAPDPGNRAELIVGTAHSGNRSVRLTANVREARGRSVQVYSDRVAVPAEALIKTSLWIKADSVDRCGEPDVAGCQNWHQLRVTLYAYDGDGNLIKPHTDILSTDGDVCTVSASAGCDWKNVEYSMITPVNTASMRVAVLLTTSTGTVWVDDLSLEVAQVLPELDFSLQKNPILIPPPARVTKGNHAASLGKVAVTASAIDDRLSRVIDEYFSSQSIEHEYNPLGMDGFGSLLQLADEANADARDLFAARFPGEAWSVLGDEGYFIVVTGMEGNRTGIVVGANSPRGHFYGLQTLKQLISGDSVYVADILDYPTNSRRGIALGLPWFSDDTRLVALDRLVGSKGNLVWLQGNHLDGVLSWDWRRYFNADQIASMRQFHSLATERFVDVHVSFGPRSRRLSSSCDKENYPPPLFSSQSEIDMLVNKMLVMYEVGYRNFGINFDDVDICGEDYLYHQQDIDFFSGSIGKAHVYFVNQVYARLKGIRDDINFMMIPLWYTRAGNGNLKSEEYLAELAGLDADIELHTVQVTDKNVDKFLSLAGRPTFLWSNYFAELKGTIYTLPYINELVWDSGKVSGFVFLPAMPDTDELNEDQSLVSWNSALSYAWAPDRYDPMEVFHLSGARYVGAEDPFPEVSRPVISPNGGDLTTGQYVTLSTATLGSEIYYSLGDADLSGWSGRNRATLYQGPFRLDAPNVLQARAYKEGFLDSEIATADFVAESGPSPDSVWFDDDLPAGAEHFGSWEFTSAHADPLSGDRVLQSGIQSGMHQYYFMNASEKLYLEAGENFFVYVYLDPENPPSQIMLQWYHGGGWEHRAYWGENIIEWGVDGTSSRRYMGALPEAGRWVRLEVPAHAVGLEGKAISGMAFTLYNGRAAWDYAGVNKASNDGGQDPADTVWLDDSVPVGAVLAGDWSLNDTSPVAFSGSLSIETGTVSGIYQNYFYNAEDRLYVNPGDTLIAYVYIDPDRPPREIMLQWRTGSNWNHRAYWGDNLIPWGDDGTASRRYMGGLPGHGRWVRLEIPAGDVGLDGAVLNGMAFTLFGGRANWDYAGKTQ